MQTLLSVTALSFNYTSRTILNALDLSLVSGEIISVLGANGAGKSTLLKCILGLQPSDAIISGEILIAGHNLLKNPNEARQNLAYVPEQAAVYEHLTAIENIKYFLSLSSTKATTDIKHCLAQVGLAEQAWHQPCQSYSKGMKQKVMLALALAKQAKLLLLDEPNSGLDPQATDELNQLILKCKNCDMGVLVVTHDVLSAFSFSDRIMMLESGKLKPIELDGSPPTLSTLQQLYQGKN